MRNTVLSYLLLPLFASIAFSLNAAPATPSGVISTSEMTTLLQQTDRVDLNSADAQTLQSALVGIGKSKALAIIAYRDEHGAFASVDELLEVKGIGKALLDRNRDKLMVN